MRRTLIELLHLAVGLIGTTVIAALAAWSVPVATETIWLVAAVAMVVVLFMGVRPLRAAWRTDRGADRLR